MCVSQLLKKKRNKLSVIPDPKRSRWDKKQSKDFVYYPYKNYGSKKIS